VDEVLKCMKERNTQLVHTEYACTVCLSLWMESIKSQVTG